MKKREKVGKPEKEARAEKESKPVKEPKGKQRAEKETKPKSEEYILKKNMGMKILRIILWAMLGFIFLRGIITIFHQSEESEVALLIQNFKATLEEEKELNNEVMAFAQNFAKEYLTYTSKGEQEYRERIKPYVSQNVYNQAGIVDFKSSAEATYTEAYRIEKYSASQIDVYVLAEVKYTSNVLEEDQETYATQEKKEKSVLKVPIYKKQGNYVIENVPMFVQDSVGIEKYSINDYKGTALKEEQATEVKTAIENFLKAYYEQDATVIDYYLSGSANRKDFAGLDGRYVFVKIVNISSFQEPGTDIISLVEYTIKDSMNNNVMTQKINLSLKKDGSRYYIDAIDIRTGNLSR